MYVPRACAPAYLGEGLHLNPGISGKFSAQGDCTLLSPLAEGLERVVLLVLATLGDLSALLGPEPSLPTFLTRQSLPFRGLVLELASRALEQGRGSQCGDQVTRRGKRRGKMLLELAITLLQYLKLFSK